MPSYSLLDLFRAYPGGVAALSERSGVPQHTIYRVANGAHSRAPLRTLSSLAEAVAAQPVLGETWRVHQLVQKWEDARATAVAAG